MDSKHFKPLKLEELLFKIEDLDANCEMLESNLKKLALAYIIFCTSLFIPVINLSPALQELWWLPSCICISVTVPFWLTFIWILDKWLQSRHGRDSMAMELENLEKESIDEKACFFIRNPLQLLQNLLKPNTTYVYRGCAMMTVGAVVLLLFVFTLIMLYVFITFPGRRYNDREISTEGMDMEYSLICIMYDQVGNVTKMVMSNGMEKLMSLLLFVLRDAETDFHPH